jgi:acetyl/propionyl-CoA carboxylase alpha subunit
MNYVVWFRGARWEIRVAGDRVVVNGVEHPARLIRFAGSPTGVLELGGRRIPVVLESRGSGRWVVGVRGDRHEVTVLDQRLESVRQIAAAARPHGPPDALRAPMPGLVVRVAIEVGQAIEAGASLVVLEAMKMENELKAVAPAIVDRIEVRPGQPVEKGEVLVRFRPVSPPP